MLIIFKTEHLEKFAPVEGHHATSGLVKVIAGNLISEMNWNGYQNKIAMKNMPIFKQICYGNF